MNWALGFAGNYVYIWRNKVLHVFDPTSFTKVKEIVHNDIQAKPQKFFYIKGNVWITNDNGSIVVLSPTTWEVLATLKQHSAYVYCVTEVGPLAW